MINDFDMVIFLRQFATFIHAGIPLIQTCELLEKTQEKTALRLMIYSIKKDILSGKNLFDSMSQHAHYFDPITCQLIRIGEQTGKLDHLLLTIANHHETRFAFRKRIKQALFYPCLLLLASMIMVFCLFLFVIPHFAILFETLPHTLPLLTRILFSLSAFIQQFVWLLILTLIGIVIVFLRIKHWQQTPSIKNFLMCLPLIKTYAQHISLAQFSRLTALMLTAGLPITEALQLSGHASISPKMKACLFNLTYQLSTGLTLHQAMRVYADFPPLMIQLVKTGEETGMLESMLNKIADFFEADINRRLEKLTLLLEPLIMLVLGVLIGGLVISLYMPVFNLGSTL